MVATTPTAATADPIVQGDMAMTETLERAHALADMLENHDPAIEIDPRSLFHVAGLLRDEIKKAQCIFERMSK